MYPQKQQQQHNQRARFVTKKNINKKSKYCRSHSKCPCGAPGAPGFLGAVFFCSCLIKGESRVHNLAICSFFWGSVVVWVLMGGEGGEKDVDCPIGW